MGGCGSKILFENAWNIYLFVHAYKGGNMQRVYGSAVRELIE
jgi:hypothetical protein